MLTFEQETDSNKCSQGLGFDHFYMQSPCNPLVEEKTEVFYMIHEVDVLSVQCEMNPRWSKSMREVGSLSFILMF